ncbi:Uncharacterised protein [BD1-7 clade bacterium]|uniref:Uncharacterized protein n=1 Tax=BD1-7 clade bacterium TaxID=2029982 RepID=A0A5S9PZQ7_9GAMM|nr:Uncharacterised protein [BD1-7 clade bacterium]
MAGNFFPENYKTFPYSEGDLLASHRSDGRYSINKVLRIDKVVLKAGETILIQNQAFEAPEEDYLLIISMSYGDDEFDSLEAAKLAADKGVWTIKMGHVPNRAPGAANGQTLIGHHPVKEGELEGYNQWKNAFIKGEAGVF